MKQGVSTGLGNAAILCEEWSQASAYMLPKMDVRVHEPAACPCTCISDISANGTTPVRYILSTVTRISKKGVFSTGYVCDVLRNTRGCK